MDIKDFWEELKERINNPFFGSLVLSWLVCNWKIPMILFFYKSEDLAKGGTNFIKIIEGYWTWHHSIAIPLVFALGYTFAYPYFKDFVKVYLARISLKTDQKLLEVSNIAKVPVAKFIETKAQLKKQEQDYALLIIEEGLIKRENETLTFQIIEKDTIIEDKTAEHLAYVTYAAKQNEDSIREITKIYEDRLKIQKLDYETIVENSENTFKAELSKVRSELTIAQVELGRLAQENDVLNAGKMQSTTSVVEAEKNRFRMERLLSDVSKKNEVLINDKNTLASVVAQFLENSQNDKMINMIALQDGSFAKYLTPEMISALNMGDLVFKHEEGWGRIIGHRNVNGNIVSLKATFGEKTMDIDPYIIGLYAPL